MAFQHETRPRSPRAGSLELSCGEADNRGLKPNGAAALQARNRMRRQRLVEHLHRLGPAPLGHFLREIEAGANIADHLERYAEIDPEFVRALGGSDFVPFLHRVPEVGP
jgi:hypothetical protein